MSTIHRRAVQSGIDSMGILPSVVNEMRNKAYYINVPASALPPQLSVMQDGGAPNARRIRGRLNDVEVSGTAYVSDASCDVFKAIVVAFEPAH